MRKTMTILAALAICLATMSVAMASPSAKHGSSRSSGGKAKSASKSTHQARKSAGSSGRKSRNSAYKGSGNRAGKHNNRLGSNQRNGSRGATARRNAATRHGAISPSTKRGSSRASNGKTKSMGAGKSAHNGRKTAASAGRKPGRSAHKRDAKLGKNRNATNNRQRNNAPGATARHGNPGKHNMGAGRNGKGRPGSPTGHGRSVSSAGTNRFNAAFEGVAYTRTATGFVIGGSDPIYVTGDYELDPGDTIVSVGGVECGESPMALTELVNEAYEVGNLVMVIQEGTSGDQIEVELPSGDSD